MKCQFNDLFQDSFGEIDYTIKEKIWGFIKKLPVIGAFGVIFLSYARKKGNKYFTGISNRTKIIKTKKNWKEGIKEFPVLHLKEGDHVKIRTRDEIESTLDEKNQFEGVEFMVTMWPYCGETHRVFKRVERILDPFADRLRRCKNMVILEGLFCHGDPAHALKCDRTCLYYWKEAWLEKIFN
ncbi:MAG: hypothetical protein V2B13_15250 [Pseudomonadota bacterium]